MEQSYRLAEALTALPSVTGFEETAFPALTEITKGYFDEIMTNPVGSFTGIVRCGKPNAKKLLLDAHLDEIGFIVSNVFDDGFLAVAKSGGVDTRVLSASEVMVYGRKPIKGVFTSKPPHLQEKGEASKPIDLSTLYIDTGYSGEELKKLVHIGDFAEMWYPCERLQNNMASSKAMDDKICAAQILRALELTDKSKLSVDIYCTFSGSEETGGHGGMTAFHAIDADYAIALDVTGAYYPDGTKNLEGMEPGKGCEIAYFASTNRAMTERLIKAAKETGEKFLIRAGGGGTGTHADEMLISRAGIPCTNFSIPLRYMHTGAEVISLEDVLSGAKIIAHLAETLD